MPGCRIAINGIGRIGKLALRQLLAEPLPGDLVLLNDAEGDPAQHAQLLEFDSIHGRWAANIAHDDQTITVDGRQMQLTKASRIDALPLSEQKIDIVFNNAGVALGRDCAVGTIDYEAWHTSLNTNVMGSMRVLETVLP